MRSNCHSYSGRTVSSGSGTYCRDFYCTQTDGRVGTYHLCEIVRGVEADGGVDVGGRDGASSGAGVGDSTCSRVTILG